LFAGCSIFQSVVNLSRTKFKVNGITDVSVANISLMNKRSVSELSVMEMINLAASFSSGRLPVRLVLAIAAKNPTDPSSGYQQSDATLKSFPFRIVLDGSEVASGNIDRPFVIPGSGMETVIPLSVQFDLVQIFKGRGKDDLLNLMMQTASKSGSSSTIAVFARPVIGTSLGDIAYPDEIKIVEKEFK
jgi:hypothetical protein